MKRIVKVLLAFAAIALLIVFQSVAINVFDKMTRGSMIEKVLNFGAKAGMALAFVIFLGSIVFGFIQHLVKSAAPTQKPATTDRH